MKSKSVISRSEVKIVLCTLTERGGNIVTNVKKKAHLWYDPVV